MKPLNYANPKRIGKINRQLDNYFVHDNPSYNSIHEQRTDNPEGRLLTTATPWRPGYLPALAYIAVHVVFLSLLFFIELVKFPCILPWAHLPNTYHSCNVNPIHLHVAKGTVQTCKRNPSLNPMRYDFSRQNMLWLLRISFAIKQDSLSYLFAPHIS